MSRVFKAPTLPSRGHLVGGFIVIIAAGLAVDLFVPSLRGVSYIAYLLLITLTLLMRDRTAAQGLAVLVSLALLAPALVGHAQAVTPAVVIERLAILATVWMLATFAMRNAGGAARRALQLVKGFEQAPTGIVLIDKTGRIVNANQAALDFCGYTLEQLTTRHAEDFFSPLDIENTRLQREELLDGRRSGLQFEKQFVHADGHEIWASLYVSIEFAAPREPEYVIVQVLDVTARREAERALQESEARFRGITENTGEITFVADEEGVLSYANPELLRVLDTAGDGAQVKSALEFIHPADHRRFLDGLAQARRHEGQTYVLPRIRLQTQNGKREVLEVKLTGLFENAGVHGAVANCRVVTDQLDAEEALRRNQAKFATIFHASPDAILIMRARDRKVLDFNESFIRMSGIAREEGIGVAAEELGVWGDPETASAITEVLRSDGECADYGAEFVSQDGQRRAVEVAARYIELNNELCVLAVIRDVSDRKRAEAALTESEERFRGAFDNAPIGTMLIDSDARILQVNKFICELLDQPHDALVGSELGAFLPEGEREDLLTAMGDLADGKLDQVRVERQMLRRDGEAIWTNRHLVLQRNQQGEPLYYIAQIADITDMKRSQEAMERLAFYDTLTELANRRLFNDRLEQAVKRATRSGTPAALLYLDLDQFKRVNDTLGHESGDVLLKEVARRLKSCVRQEDTVARPGGDEFTVLLSEVRDAGAAGTVAEHILEALRDPIDVAGHQLIVTTSIGITLTPNDGRDPAQLTKNADLAMYRAKERGRNNYQFYAEEMNTSAMARLKLEHELRAALENREFELYFQPKVRLADQQIVGAEALVRWHHPSRGVLQPSEFMAVAEDTGVIVELGAWVLDEACRLAHELAERGSERTSLAVNISARQFRDPVLVDQLRTAIAASRLDPAWLELEITETMLMTDIEDAAETLQRFRDLGVKLAIDDFGTGYSSLNYLKRLPINIIKVDRAFVSDIPDSADDKAIAAAVIAMAHELNLEVVAEGVETPEQLFFLSEHGCEYGQGFLFSAPQPFELFADMLRPGTRKAAL